jgi:hypothetical protein
MSTENSIYLARTSILTHTRCVGTERKKLWSIESADLVDVANANEKNFPSLFLKTLAKLDASFIFIEFQYKHLSLAKSLKLQCFSVRPQRITFLF